MNSTHTKTSIRWLLSAVWLLALPALGQDVTPPAPPAPEEPSATLELEVETPDAEESVERDSERDADDEPRHRAIVHFGGNSRLGANESADAVISVFGSSTSEGDVREAVVSVFGDSRVSGSAHDVVSVFGNTYVNGRIDDSVVAAFGNLELGPDAHIGGEAVAIGGTIKRHPDAVIRGGVEEVAFGSDFFQFQWLTPWIEECLLLGRLLAPTDGIEWAWTLAAGFLILYVVIALMFSGPVTRCVETLEDHPGESTLAALISVFLVPVVFVLLCVTIIGIVLVPFYGLALFVVGLLGKTVILAAIGRRITRHIGGGPFAHIAFAVLIGGMIITALYMVPILGFITYNVTGILGFGVIVYAALSASRANRARSATASGPDIAPGSAPAAEFAAAPETIGSDDAAFAQASAAEPIEPTLPPTALPRAEFMIRMGALIIDLILVGIIANMIPGSGDIGLLAIATYGALMWKLKGTTIGGIICNLRVVRVDGREMDWPTAIVRALGCFLSLFAVFLGFLWIIFDPERQAWHDKIAGTIVVRAPRSGGLVR